MFLNPLLLFGLSAMSVPVIIHLMNRRKFDRVAWAAMRFLQMSIERNRRRLRLEDLILLLLRCSIVCLLALTLARPIWHFASMGGWNAPVAGKTTAVIVLDNSESMGQTDGAETRFEQAQKIVDGIVESLPGDSSATLMLASDTATPVIDEPMSDLAKVHEFAHKAKHTDRSTDLLPAIDQAMKTLRNKPSGRKDVYVITDGQASGWKQAGDIQRLLESQKDLVTANIIFVGQPETGNLGVSDLRLAADMAIVNQPMRFDVQVTNYGKADVRNVPVRLALDGDAPLEETTLDLIPAGESRSVSLFGRIRSEGFHTVAAHIPPDCLPADDVRTIAIHCLKKVDVLVVDGQPGATLRDSESYLLQQALQPVAPEQRKDYYVQVHVITPDQLDITPLDQFDTVVLANVPSISANVTNQVMAFLRQGKGLIVFPGDAVHTAFYNDELYRRLNILPAALGDPQGDATQTEQFTTFNAGKYDHPIAARWNDVGAGHLDQVHFYRWFPLVIAPHLPSDGIYPTGVNTHEIGPSQVVLRYSDNSPAIVEHTWAGGTVVLFSSTASTHWNDLPAHPQIFIPLLHRSIGLILQSGDAFLNVKVGQPLVVHPPAELVGHDANILLPRRGEAIERVTSKVVLVDGKPTLTYDATDLAGTYAIEFVGSTTTYKVAAQQDPEESRLDALSPAQVDTLRHVANVVQWKPGISLNTVLNTTRATGDLWKYPAMLVLVLAVMETLLAHWFSQAK
jgi:hypothetical protein